MNELVAFVRARLEEEESAARATFRPSGPSWAEVGREERIPERAHIARHDPARVLREVEAIRAIVDEYAPVARNDGPREPEYAYGWAEGLGMAVRALAAIWRDYPGYDLGWAP